MEEREQRVRKGKKDYSLGEDVAVDITLRPSCYRPEVACII